MTIKKFSRSVKKYAKKRYLKKGAVNMSAVVKDVKFLKSVLNPEKKRFQVTEQSAKVGQVNINAEGYFAREITALPAQGDTGAQRNGNSIRLHSTDIKLQMIQQSVTLGAIKFRYYVFSSRGNGAPFVNADAAVTALLSHNSFNGMIDYNSDRNVDAMGQVTVIRTGTFTLASSQVNTTADVVIKDVRIGLLHKNNHVKFLNNTTTVLSGVMYFVIVADSGNVSETTNSTVINIPTTGKTTAATMNMDLTHYYYDN